MKKTKQKPLRIFLYFSKSFATVNNILLSKLSRQGLRDTVLECCCFLTLYL